jgi:hypothetical protein
MVLWTGDTIVNVIEVDFKVTKNGGVGIDVQRLLVKAAEHVDASEHNDAVIGWVSKEELWRMNRI